MRFDFNLYSTPLLFGFVQGGVYALLFFFRGWRQGRLSDWLFGGLLITFVFEIWEYMLGFAGIEFLWREWNFFPRNLGLLLPPLAYLYLKSQFNADFRLHLRDFLHALPFVVYVIYRLAIFAQGQEFVQYWEENVHEAFCIDLIESALIFTLQLRYFFKAYQLYRNYRDWAPNQFSDTDAVSFAWYRNFLWAFFFSNVFGWTMTIIDLRLNLDFWHDWWDELFNAGLIYYLAIQGYAQVQPRQLHFSPTVATQSQSLALGQKNERLPEADLQRWKTRIEQCMAVEKPYLDPELSLPALAQRLGANTSVLSATINTAFGKNFNDFVNEYRVEAVKQMLKDPASSHFSLLGIGLECGFNSKSTFNRVFKKMTGISPGDFASPQGQ